MSPDKLRQSRETHLQGFQKPDYLQALSDKFGLRFDEYRQLWKDSSTTAAVPEFPLHLELELNNYCNLRCSMCHFAEFEHDPANRKHMELDLLDSILRECKGQLPALLLGSGTEPLLHPHIAEIIRHANDADVMDIILSTNGLLLSEHMMSLLVDLEIARVTVSLDAATAATYGKIRGGDLERVEQNLYQLIRLRNARGARLPYLRVTFVVQKENEHEMEGFAQKWRPIADRVDFQKLLPVYTDLNNHPPGEMIKGVCAQPFQRLTVDYDGDVFPCCTYYKKHLRLGNLRDASLKHFWCCDEMASLRRNLRDRDFCSACAKCLSYSAI